MWNLAFQPIKKSSSTTRMPMITKLGRVVTYREEVQPQSYLIMSALRDHLEN